MIKPLSGAETVLESFWSASATSAATFGVEKRPHFRGCCNKIKGTAASRALLALALTFDSPGCERTRCHGDPKPLHSSASKRQPSGSPWPTACTMRWPVLQPHGFVLPLGGWVTGGGPTEVHRCSTPKTGTVEFKNRNTPGRDDSI